MKKENTYVDFLNMCAEKVQELYPGRLQTEICSTLKNNGVEVTGILIKEKGEPLAPNFYLEGHYEKWLEAESTLEEIVEGMMTAYEEEMEKNRIIADTLKFEWDDFKKHVYIRLIGRDSNAAMLRDVPYEEYLDMAVVYHYVIEVSEETRGVLMITNDHLRILGITKEELREEALANTRNNMRPVISRMDEMIVRLGISLGIPMSREKKRNFMYILSNASGSYGAVSMMFGEELERFSNEIRSSFYILPSSVHEVILVPDCHTVTAEVFSRMVKDVNATQVEEMEVLTDSVYYYDREMHTVRRVA